MRFNLQCKECEAQCWVRGYEEPDVNAVVLDESKKYEWEDNGNLLYETCQHSDFDIIDSELDYEDD